MVSHLQTGLLTKPKDAHALAEQLQWMVEHPHERARMGVNGRDVVCKEYTSAIQAGRYVSLNASFSKLRRSLSAARFDLNQQAQRYLGLHMELAGKVITHDRRLTAARSRHEQS